MTTRPGLVTPDGGWQHVDAAWADRGTVVVYGSVPDWLPRHRAQERQLVRGEAGRWERLRGCGQRRRFLSSRFLLRSVVGRLTAESWQAVEPCSTSLGRPLVPRHPALRLSLSHTGALLVASVSRCGPVGVDAEPLKRRTAGAEHRICTPEELLALPPGPRCRT